MAYLVLVYSIFKKKELYINEKDVYAAHWTPAFLLGKRFGWTKVCEHN